MPERLANAGGEARLVGEHSGDARFGQLPKSSAAAAGGKASVASAPAQQAYASEADYYSHYGYDNYRESKQVCLAEQRQRNCGMYGCELRRRRR